MTPSRRPNLAIRKVFVGLAALCGLAGEAAAAPVFQDGPIAKIGGVCPGTATPLDAVGAWAGYVVDPVAMTPKLGEVVYVHATASNLNPCGGETVGFNFFLPPGTQLAISAQNPVQCFYGNGTTGGAAPNCLQNPQTRIPNSFYFGFYDRLAPGWFFEVQVPVVFTQALANASLRVTTETVWGNFDATVGVTAPYATQTSTGSILLPIITPVVAPIQVVQPTAPFGTHGDDLALLGSASAGSTLPIAFANDDGTFTVTNYDVGNFGAWSRLPNVKRLSGDFNRDGLLDYALVGGTGWTAIPVALSRSDGRFNVLDLAIPNFGAWAASPNVKPIVGDFDRDGDADIALVGGAGWNTMPIAFSRGDGTFYVTNSEINNFASWAAGTDVRPIAGDFNRDGMTDIALVGGAGWTTLPVAFSYGDGTFNVTNANAVVTRFVNAPGAFSYYSFNFAAAARAPGAQVVTGDFNKDGMTDLAVVGGSEASSTIETALSYGNGRFGLIPKSAPGFATAAMMPGAKLLVGDFNKDGYSDLALTGAAGWNTVQIATSRSGGDFSLVPMPVGDFGAWASTAGVRAVVGDYNGDGYSDIALVGGANWASIPIALGASGGLLVISNKTTLRFPAWAADPGATVLAGRTHY